MYLLFNCVFYISVVYTQIGARVEEVSYLPGYNFEMCDAPKQEDLPAVPMDDWDADLSAEIEAEEKRHAAVVASLRQRRLKKDAAGLVSNYLDQSLPLAGASAAPGANIPGASYVI